ncbi:AAA family ATPase [Flavobacterium algoritolerans]|uniref:ATP-binding protein n=1 Tax=Flavobacterium algoritolerans TaxID=3041254 RepID=A0ABT6VDJ1_9FLAO|nr:ATP-binding protein [Flavobacterium algoritolerans]MDI5895976.1 ATP-binding protein [Flavobacterium algoritolerans]
MIQELKISNFLSFKEEVTFSFEATKDKTFEEYQVVEVAPDVRLLRFAMVYGANASGKSNLLNAIEFLHDFWFDRKNDVTAETGVVPFKFDKITPKQPSNFSLKFYVKDVKYWYLLELDEHKVISEKLYYYSSVQPTLLFDRTIVKNVSVVNFNTPAVKISAVAREEINLKCLPNMSFFAARNQVNVALPIVDEAREWLKQSVMNVVTPNSSLFDYAEHTILKDNDLKGHLLEFIKEADFNISNIETTSIKKDIPEEFLDMILKSDRLPDDEKERLKKEKNITHLKTDFEHTVTNDRGIEKYYLSESLQSEGTRRITGLESVIYSALQEESLMVIDEIESSLHPNLIEFVLKKFLEKKDNRSQLLITTHYDPLLNEIDQLFRKDSVWFTEKNESGATELYSLVEFTGLNRIASLQKAYRSGRFGGVPKINL